LSNQLSSLFFCICIKRGAWRH